MRRNQACSKESLGKGTWARKGIPAGNQSCFPRLFEEMCHLGKGQLEEFWDGAEAAGDDQLNGHPVPLGKEWESYTVPLFLHVVGVELQNRDSLLVFSWGTWLSSMNSLQNRMLVPKAASALTLRILFGNELFGA